MRPGLYADICWLLQVMTGAKNNSCAQAQCEGQRPQDARYGRQVGWLRVCTDGNSKKVCLRFFV